MLDSLLFLGYAIVDFETLDSLPIEIFSKVYVYPYNGDYVLTSYSKVELYPASYYLV